MLCDLLAGYLIYHILMRQKCRKKAALFCAQSWLFNPITMAVSTRGNAESLIAVFVLLMLSSLMEGHVKHLILGATAYAVSVHMKIYPVTYALAIYLYIDKKYWQTKVSKTSVAFDLLPNRYRFLAGCTGAVVFALCTGFCYYLWVHDFNLPHTSVLQTPSHSLTVLLLLQVWAGVSPGDISIPHHKTRYSA